MKETTMKLRKNEVLVMKVVEADGSAHGGFKWPLEAGATVEAPDWKPAASCGNGLHGWLWGLGDLNVCDARHEKADAVWMALVVVGSGVIDLNGKVKFPRCRIALVGDRVTVANYIAARRPANTPVPMFAQAAAGYAGQAAAGDAGQAAAGYRGQAAAGEAGQAAAGYAGQAAAGSRGQAAAGYAGQAAAGSRGQAAAGDAGQAAAGYRGQAAAGSRGQAAAGEAGQAAAGSDGLATAGIGGIVKGGKRAVLVAEYWIDQDNNEHTYAVGQVGRGGIEPETWYEGTADGLRKVESDDRRIASWNAAWKLFDERNAARDALAKKSDDAQSGAAQELVAASARAVNP